MQHSPGQGDYTKERREFFAELHERYLLKTIDERARREEHADPTISAKTFGELWHVTVATPR